MEYPVEWPKVVEKLAAELAQMKVQMAMAAVALDAVIEQFSEESEDE